MKRIISTIMGLDNQTIISTVTGCIVGGIISLIITHIYYKKSGKELEGHVEELSKEIGKLKEINENMEQKVNLQIERDFKRDNGEEAIIINKNDKYGLQTSSSVNCELTVVAKEE